MRINRRTAWVATALVGAVALTLTALFLHRQRPETKNATTTTVSPPSTALTPSPAPVTTPATVDPTPPLGSSTASGAPTSLSPSPSPSSSTATAGKPSPTSTPGTQPAFSTAPGRALPDTLYGVTTEAVENLGELNAALRKHTQRPTTRIVFQDGSDADYYVEAVKTLRQTSYLMGEILDSTGMENISVQAYQQRAREFVQTFGSDIDIYEIGNELNGEWLGSPDQTIAKVQAAYDVVEKENAAKNLRSAITLNYWPSSDCYSQPWEDTTTFAQSLPAEVRQGVDYVLLSFYETACSPRATPTNEQFISIFTKLMTIFPHAKVGMGEMGSQGTQDGVPAPSLSEKQAILNRYYGMHSALRSALGSRYVGGYFWWYYNQEVTGPNGSTMWSTLEKAFNAM